MKKVKTEDEESKEKLTWRKLSPRCGPKKSSLETFSRDWMVIEMKEKVKRKVFQS